MPIIIALDSDTEKIVTRSGSASRVLVALSQHPEGLTIPEICEITNLTEKTVYVKGVRQLFHAQLIGEEKTKTDAGVKKIYKLKDISIHDPSQDRAGKR